MKIVFVSKFILIILASLLTIDASANAYHVEQVIPKLIVDKEITQKINLEYTDEDLSYLGSQINTHNQYEVYFWKSETRQILKWTPERGFKHFIQLTRKRILKGFGFTQGKNVNLLIQDLRGREQIERYSRKGQRIVHIPIDLSFEHDTLSEVRYKNPYYYIADEEKSFKTHKWGGGKHQSFYGQILMDDQGHYTIDLSNSRLLIYYYDEEGNIQGRKNYMAHDIDMVVDALQVQSDKLAIISEYEYDDVDFDLGNEEMNSYYQVRHVSLDDYSTDVVEEVFLTQKIQSNNHFWSDKEGNLYITNLEKNVIKIWKL